MLRLIVPCLMVSAAFVATVAGLIALPDGTARANAPIMIGPGDLPPDVFVAINPCTGEEQEVVVSPGKGTIHEFVTPSGSSHVVLSLHKGTISTSDGYSGRAQFMLLEGDDTGHGTFSNVINQQVSNDNGVKYIIHLTVHATFANGELVVAFEHFSARCVGNHNGG